MAWKLLQGDVLDKLSEIETGTVYREAARC